MEANENLLHQFSDAGVSLHLLLLYLLRVQRNFVHNRD